MRDSKIKVTKGDNWETSVGNLIRKGCTVAKICRYYKVQILFIMYTRLALHCSSNLISLIIKLFTIADLHVRTAIFRR